MPALKNVPIEATERAWIEVDLGALRKNIRVISDRVGDGSRLLPMVKADAYGVGMECVVRALRPLGPWGFGVATTAEGRAVRRTGWDGPVVVFAPTLPSDLACLAQERLEPVIPGIEALVACAEPGAGEPLAVHLEVDTGMGRLGLGWDSADVWAPVVASVLGTGGLRLAGTMTHFHSAEQTDEATSTQWSRMLVALEAMRAAGVDPGLVHAANSAGAMLHPAVAADLVRPGIYLYGGGSWEPPAEPVVSLRARVLAVRDVAAGATVCYGATWTADRPTRLATVAVGYGDGLRRELSNRGRALIHGVTAPIRGVVCMDTVVVDVTGRDDVRPGDVATLLGEDQGARIGLAELARLCGTIDYEILTGLGARLPRLEVDRVNADVGNEDAVLEALETIRDGI
jgi:alanine racemase